MKIKHLLLPLLLLATPVSYACVNIYDYTLKGAHIGAYDHPNLTLESIGEHRTNKARHVKEKLAEFRCKISWTHEEASDYAALLMMDLQLEKAKNILDTLLQKDSLSYTFNSNYGTLMELMGNNAAALKYIKRSVQIDPESHNRSEWIHVKVLEAKLAMNKDAGWCLHHHVLDEKPGINAIDEIIYQLDERTFFIQPKDFVVCDLFFTLGETVLKYDQGVILARKAFELSVFYGDWHKNICVERLAMLSIYPKEYYDEEYDGFTQTLTGVVFFCFFIFTIVLFYKRSRHANLH